MLCSRIYVHLYVPVRRVCAVQVLLHPCISLQGRTTTLYMLSQVRSDSAHTGAVSLQWICSLPSAAMVSYNSAPRTADHEISNVSVEIRDTDTSSGQHGTEDREREKLDGLKKKHSICKVNFLIKVKYLCITRLSYSP